MPEPLVENAPAKVNLTLRVLRRRGDGYHDIESLVAFAGCGDRLTLTPGGVLTLAVAGPQAEKSGDVGDNLVLKVARALQTRIPGIALGAFHLEKNLPVAAGIGGGSADAAAALRLLAGLNNLALGDPRLFSAARATGADVPVCLDPRPRVMRGIGENLSAPLDLPALDAVLVNPGIALATRDVFAGWKSAGIANASLDLGALAKFDREELLHMLAAQPNDLEAAAVALGPPIADVLAALRVAGGCRLARMSGSGSTCFGVFETAEAAQKAAEVLGRKYPRWWTRATSLGTA